jgi:hypothetical protein
MAPVSRELWDKEKMVRALRSVRAGHLEQRRGEKQFSVLKGSMERHVKDYVKSLQALVAVNLGRRLILPNHIESELVKYCIEMDARYFRLRRNA